MDVRYVYASYLDLDNAIHEWRDDGISVRLFRGANMKSAQHAYGELAAVLQFPMYFGWNIAAVDELMTDPDWVNLSGVRLVVSDANLVFIEESAPDGRRFAEVFADAHAFWDGFDRPFSMILVAGSPTRAVPDLWQSLGASLVAWDPLVDRSSQ